METLESVKQQIQNRIAQKRNDAMAFFREADEQRMLGEKTMAEVAGLETALDYLKDVKENAS